MDIYQHFRKEEQPFIDQLLSWKEDVERTYTGKLTDFLDPREQYIFASIIGNNPDLSWELFGGNDYAERKRALLVPFYEEISNERFELVLLEASYPSKFVQLEHRDVLGAFMSLGVKRKKQGDLIVLEDKIQIIVSKDIASYVMMNLTGIKKASVNFVERPLHELKVSQDEWIERDGTVSSMRLDGVLKEIYNLSRQKASLYIEKGHVKVNFRMVEDAAFQLEAGDIISVRGLGRSKLKEIHGKTKKEKWRITTAKLK